MRQAELFKKWSKYLKYRAINYENILKYLHAISHCTYKRHKFIFNNYTIKAKYSRWIYQLILMDMMNFFNMLI